MGRKNLIRPYKLLTAQSLAVDFETEPSNIENVDNFAYLIDATGITDNTGSYGVEIRYKIANTSELSAWVPLSLSEASIYADVDTKFYIYLNGLVASEVRLTFVAAGGTPDGVATIWISGNMIGG